MANLIRVLAQRGNAGTLALTMRPRPSVLLRRSHIGGNTASKLESDGREFFNTVMVSPNFLEKTLLVITLRHAPWSIPKQIRYADS